MRKIIIHNVLTQNKSNIYNNVNNSNNKKEEATIIKHGFSVQLPSSSCQRGK